MLIKDLTDTDLSSLLKSGLHFKVGPFVYCIKSRIPAISTHIRQLYSSYEIPLHREFSDFPVELFTTLNPLKGFRQVFFSFDGNEPFTPLPLDQSTAMLEWAMNWCISSNAHQYLIIHSAVVAHNDRAIILPGEPGAGKSTLCAALVHAGWRLLSDELTLIELETGSIVPIPKPIGLKNKSIEIIRNLDPNANIGRVCYDTVKGTVSHLGAPTTSVTYSDRPATASFVIFPRYNAYTGNRLTEKSRGMTYMMLVENAFNYHLLGEKGFNTLSSLVNGIEGFDFIYKDMEKAVETLKEMVA